MPQTLELLLRRASLAPTSIDEKARTASVVWSTGAPVQRRDYEGPFLESLSLNPNHVRMNKLVGASVLNSHKQGDLSNVLGVVTDAGTDGGGGWANIKFSSRAEIDPIWQDVRDGIIRSVSVGYSVSKWEDAKDPVTGLRKRTAVDWTPQEISLVALPADSGATIRSKLVQEDEILAQLAPVVESRAETNKKIRNIATIASLDTQFADGLIDRGATIDQARAAAFEEMGRRSGGPIHSQRLEIHDSHDDPAKRVERMAEALTCRLHPTQKPSEAAKQYMHRRVLEMASELLEVRGERGVSLMSPDTILARANTTSDFPTLLQSTGNRVLMAAFQAAPNPLKTLARQALINDFRPKTAVKLGPMGKLPKINEKGEVKSTSRTEAKEAYSLATFAEIFSLSRQAIINDDLGAFNDWSVAMGRAASETEADQLVQLLTANSGAGATLDDGAALFNSAHANVAGSGGVISTATLSAGRQAMRGQTQVDGKTLINATPKYLLVSPVKETEAESVLAQLYPAQVSNVNPFASNRYELLVEPRFAGNSWYLFADPAVQAVLEYAYLTSAQGPQMASRAGWDVLGMEFRVTLDFGAGVVDHRGAYRNPGA